MTPERLNITELGFCFCPLLPSSHDEPRSDARRAARRGMAAAAMEWNAQRGSGQRTAGHMRSHVSQRQAGQSCERPLHTTLADDGASRHGAITDHGA